MSKTNLTFDTMAQAASQTGIPLAILKRSKAKGCPAFKLGSRVNLPDFLKWYYEQPEVVEIDLQHERARLTQAQAVAKELENSVTEGRLHCLADIELHVWHNCLDPLRRKLEAMPRSLAGQITAAPDQAEQILLTWADATKLSIASKSPTP